MKKLMGGFGVPRRNMTVPISALRSMPPYHAMLVPSWLDRYVTLTLFFCDTTTEDTPLRRICGHAALVISVLSCVTFASCQLGDTPSASS
jgi:hypothetical protein